MQISFAKICMNQNSSVQDFPVIKANNVSKKRLQQIWAQVPLDYYDQGIKKNILQKLWHTRKLAQVLKLLPKNSQAILDVGCSSGLLTAEIYKSVPTSKITGLDSYKDAIAFARSKYPTISFIVGDAHKLPFKNKTFDLVVCTETLEHLVDPKKALQEIKRVLKNQGKTIISMDSGSLLFRITWALWIKTKGKVWQDAHLHEFNAKILEDLIRKTGFKIKKVVISHLGMAVTFLAEPK